MVKIYGNDMFVIDSNVKGSEDQSAHPNEEDTVVFFHGFPWYVKVILWNFLKKVFGLTINQKYYSFASKFNIN